MLDRHVALLHVAVQQLQELLHDASVHHVDAVAVCRQKHKAEASAAPACCGGLLLLPPLPPPPAPSCLAQQSLPLRAKLAMAKAPASCSWWLWDGIQERTLWKTLPLPPSNSFCMDSSEEAEDEEG